MCGNIKKFCPKSISCSKTSTHTHSYLSYSQQVNSIYMFPMNISVRGWMRSRDHGGYEPLLIILSSETSFLMSLDVVAVWAGVESCWENAYRHFSSDNRLWNEHGFLLHMLLRIKCVSRKFYAGIQFTLISHHTPSFLLYMKPLILFMDCVNSHICCFSSSPCTTKNKPCHKRESYVGPISPSWIDWRNQWQKFIL
jgi:hypothetical protein